MNYSFLLNDYNIANQKVLKLESKIVYHDCNELYNSYNRGKEKVFSIEDQLDENEKLDIVNYHTNNLGTYILDIIDNYWECIENGELKQTKWGSINRNSLMKFIKKYDTRNILFTHYDISYPFYHMFHEEYSLCKDHMTPKTSHNYKMLYDGKKVVNQWFHDLLVELYNKEKQYFDEHDPKRILYNDTRKEINDLIDTLYKIPGMFDILNNSYKDMDINKIKEIREVVNDVQTYIKDKIYDLKNGDE